VLSAWRAVNKNPDKHEAKSKKHGAQSMSTKHKARSMSTKQRQKNWALLCSCFAVASLFLLLLLYKQKCAEGPTMVGSTLLFSNFSFFLSKKDNIGGEIEDPPATLSSDVVSA
jgi:hypothetical protein